MGYGQNVGQEAQQSTYMQYTHSKVLVRKDGTSGEQGTYLETSGHTALQLFQNILTKKRIGKPFLDIHRNLKHKEFLNFCEGFLR